MKKKYIIFQLYDDVCALDVDDIHEIIELDSMVKTSSKELNLCFWKKVTVPVVDPMAMMSLDEHEPSLHSRIIVVEKRALKFGILVDQVMGVMEFNVRDFEEPDLDERRYVSSRVDEFKIFSPDIFLTERMMAKFRQAYQTDLSGMEDAETIHGERAQGKEEIVEQVRLRSLNWLISATRKNVDEAFINEAIEIHNLVARL